MALKEDFTKQVESQLAVWQGQIKDYQDRLAQAGTEAHVQYEKAMGSLRENADQASKLLAQARGSSEAAWKDMQAASRQGAGATAAGLGRRAEALPVGRWSAAARRAAARPPPGPGVPGVGCGGVGLDGGSPAPRPSTGKPR